MTSFITQSVGKSGVNKKKDVELIQILLNHVRQVSNTPKLGLDGVAGSKTVEKIRLFQSKVLKMRSPDSRVDPKGRTIKSLINEAKYCVITKPLAVKKNHVMSTKAITLLKGIEKLALESYDDQTGKKIDKWVKGATIGYGHLIHKSDWEKYKAGISKAEADSLFKKDIRPFVNTVNSSVKVALSQNEFDALVILAFNIGAGAFKSSSVLKMINDPSAKTPYSSIEAAWKAWNKSQGKVMRGLNNRRNSEWNIYEKGIYKRW